MAGTSTTDGLLAALRLAYRRGAKEYREALAHVELTPRQAALLLAIEAHPGHGVKFAAGQIGADVPTCSALVSRLEERGLVARRNDPGDRRRTRLYVTDEADELIAIVRAARLAADRRLTTAAGDEADLLRDLLRRLAQRLDEVSEVVEA